MRAIAAIDRFVLERAAQPVADLVTRISGRTCYWLAGQAAIGGTVALEAAYFVDITGGHMMAIATLLGVGFLFYGRRLYREAQRMEERSWRTHERSSLAARTRAWLPIFFLMVAMDFVSYLRGEFRPLYALSDAAALCWGAYSYFLDCRPRAPAAKPRLATEVA